MTVELIEFGERSDDGPFEKRSVHLEPRRGPIGFKAKASKAIGGIERRGQREVCGRGLNERPSYRHYDNLSCGYHVPYHALLQFPR